MSRQQLPPQIKPVTLPSGKHRYMLVCDTGSVNGRRKQIRRMFKTEQAAKDKLSEVQGAVRSGAYVQVSKSTVEAACEDWLNSKHRIKPSTLRGYNVWLAPLRETLGDVEVQKLTKADLNSLVIALKAGEIKGHGKWTPRSINGMLGIVSAILEDQLKQGQVVRNVAKLVDRLPGEKTEMKVLSEADMFKILDYPDRDRHLWTLALYGLRRGEIAGLRWKFVDFEAGTIEIIENRTVAGRDIIVGTPKSMRSRRVLPMPEEVLEVLRDAKSRIESEYVASDEFGQPYHPNLLTFRWERLLDKLGIERVRLHDARHSCATLMHMRGVPMAVIAAWLGHASAAFTVATYTHAETKALEGAALSFRPKAQ